MSKKDLDEANEFIKGAESFAKEISTLAVKKKLAQGTVYFAVQWLARRYNEENPHLSRYVERLLDISETQGRQQ
ncbi:MAG TPA: hypothetical protein VEF04_09480 [Blastocatellia bacterium]|nr:hypothetical protein [Blastocatellia bacterium]